MSLLKGFTYSNASSYDSFNPLVARNSDVLGSNPGQVGYLSSRLCIYSAPNCSKVGVYSDVYGTVHYNEPLKSFDTSGV